MTSEKKPWERSPLEIEIIDCYEAEIMGETIHEGEDCYCIEFHDYDMSIVEAMILKDKFKNFPHPIKKGTPFGIILYKDKGKLSVGSWPVQRYWSKELVEFYSNEDK